MGRKALLIGVDYKGTDNELKGCINDIDDVNQMLLDRGFSKSDITILTDDTAIKPTCFNIKHHFKELIETGETLLYFHYSGHGSLVRDENTDKPSKMDCAIVPIDFQENGFITDDMFRVMINEMKSSSTLVGVLDSCHSGTCFDLLYTVSSQGQDFLLKTDHIHKETNGFVVLLSGCADNQTSADAFINNKPQGALTYTYLKVLTDNNYQIAYDKLLTDCRKSLAQNSYTQKPQLSFGKYVNLHQNFHF